MKRVDTYKGFKTNQLVLDGNKTLARIVYIEIDDDLSIKYNREIVFFRLGLINEEGFEFANVSVDIDSIYPLPFKLKVDYRPGKRPPVSQRNWNMKSTNYKTKRV